MRKPGRLIKRGARSAKDFKTGMWRAAVFAVPLMLFLAGCCCFGGRAQQRGRPDPRAPSGANVHVARVSSPVHCVAVMPFQAATELIGISTSDLFVTELLRTGRYQLVERSQLARVLNEAEVALSGLSDARAVELGNMLGADGVIIGTVDEYGAIALRGRNLAVVGLSVRMIDCESGRVMWSASYALTATDPQVPLSQHCRTVVRGTVMALSREWRVQRQVPPERRPGASLDQPIGRSATAAPVVAPPPREPPPAVPTFTLSDLGLREVELQWSNPRVSGLEYRIERSSSPSGPFEQIARVPALRGGYPDRGTQRAPLQDATTYYYRLTAISASGLESPASPVHESMTAPPPRRPDGLRADTPAGRAVTLTWTPAREEGITHYAVERASPPDYEFRPIGEVTVPSFSEGGSSNSPLADAIAYRYRILAGNRVGAISEPSEPIEVKTRPPPQPVRRLAGASRQPRRVPLSWLPSPEEDVVRYEIERAAGEAGSFARIASVDGRTNAEYTDLGDVTGSGRRAALAPLADHTRYWYRIRAVNSVESVSAWSATIDATTKPVPAVPAGVRAGAGEVNRVTVTWKANREKDIAVYIVSASTTPDLHFMEIARVEPGGNPAPMFIEEPLRPGITRYYRIRAVDADGLESEWSGPVPGATKPAPDAPTGLTMKWEEEGARLSWTPPAQPDVVRYRIWEQRVLRGNTELRVVEKPEYLLSPDEVGRRLNVTVTAVDKDGLESVPGEILEIRPPN